MQENWLVGEAYAIPTPLVFPSILDQGSLLYVRCVPSRLSPGELLERKNGFVCMLFTVLCGRKRRIHGLTAYVPGKEKDFPLISPFP